MRDHTRRRTIPPDPLGRLDDIIAESQRVASRLDDVADRLEQAVNALDRRRRDGERDRDDRNG